MGGLTVGQGAAHSQVHKVIYNIEFIIIKKNRYFCYQKPAFLLNLKCATDELTMTPLKRNISEAVFGANSMEYRLIMTIRI